MASLLLFTLLLCVSTTIPTLAENIRIDCGTSGSYKGSNSETWLGDENFVTTGKPYKLPDKYKFEKPFNTVRNYPPGQKDKCYRNIPAIKGGKTLVRTMFFYDNKDTKEESLDHVCVKHSSLLRQSTFFFFYPLDPYGRLWFPHKKANLNEPKTSASSIDITDASNKPPETVMSNAWSAIDLRIVNLPLPLTDQLVYLALYFSEARSLKQTEIRSFNVLLDNKLISPEPIVPVLGKVTQVIERKLKATSKSQLTFKPTEDSNLPPLINAFELYLISYSHVGGYVDTEKKEIPKPDPLDNETFKKLKKGGTSVWQKLKLPVIIGTPTLGLGLASVFVLWKKSSKAKSNESNTLPTTSAGDGTVSGISPLIGQQLKSDAKQPGSN